MNHRNPTKSISIAIAALATAATTMVHAIQLEGYEAAFGLAPEQVSKQFTAQEISSSSPANAFFPKEPVEFTWQLTNLTDQPIEAKGTVNVYTYKTMSDQIDCFKLSCERTGELKPATFRASIPANGWSDSTVKLQIPDEYGAYVAVIDIDGCGRQFGAAFIRCPRPVPGKVQFPTYAMDIPTYNVCEPALALFQRIGVKGVRIEWGYECTTNQFFEGYMKRLDEVLNGFADHDITVMITMAAAGHAQQPNGDFRPWLEDDGTQTSIQQRDMVALPSFDNDYRAFSARIAATYGWPRGPVNAMELWNEPWEGISISGWGSDMVRYREIFTAMAQGIEQARQAWGVDVLIGGTCSTMNTEDKLFCDGTDDFLKWLDFTSIHYQPLAAWGPLVKKWVQRDNPRGPTRIWDTESWIANSEDRVAAAIASMRAQGQSRTAGVLHDASYNIQRFRRADENGVMREQTVVQTWAPALAVATVQQYIGQREFKEILFKNGLPWVFVFDGLDGNADDGCAVVVGDLGGLYNRHRILHREVYELGRREQLDAIQAKIDALPSDADKNTRSALENEWLATAVMQNGRMTLSNAKKFTLFDYFGNAIKTGSTIDVPLNGLGYILRTDGSKGSFDALLASIRNADIRGFEPVDITMRDFIAPISEHPALRVSAKNILNRDIKGTIKVAIDGLVIDNAERTVEIPAGESADLEFTVSSGDPLPSNLYKTTVTFDAGADGAFTKSEDMRVNIIAKRAIAVDGDLRDWEGVLPQSARRGGSGAPSQTEKAWLPFATFEEGVADGVAVCHLAYDDAAFYVAMRVADSTPFEGGIRYETRDDDSYFYPDTYYRKNQDGTKTELHWPAGVRHYTYRRQPDIPSADHTDNLQLAFNVVPENEKADYLDYLPGTMPHFMAWPSTDYEFVFNQVADKFGGGTEIWKLYSPGAPRKHFYPRQPKAPNDGGPVKDGQLAMKRDGNTRILEASLPWSQIPLVKEALDAGRTVKLTFRVNDNGGGSFELAANRSASQVNVYALHDYWADSWATEIEFAFEK